MRSTPLTAVFSSRKTAASTISAMLASRPMGVWDVYFATAAGFSDQYGLSPTTPGWIELTRSGFSSSTRVRVSPTTPAVDGRDRRRPRVRPLLGHPAEQDDRRVVGQPIAQGVDDLRVADELEGHEPDGPADVVVGDGVLVAIDGREDQPPDRPDVGERRGDGRRARPGRR